MAAWTSPNSRSSTSLSANCARSWRRRRAAIITSRPSGAAAMCCATRSRRRPTSRRLANRGPTQPKAPGFEVDNDPAAKPRRHQSRKIGARRPRAQLLDRHRERQCRADRFARAIPLALAVEPRRTTFDTEDQAAAARQRLATDRRHVAGEFLPFDWQPTDAFAVIAGDRAFLEQ